MDIDGLIQTNFDHRVVSSTFSLYIFNIKWMCANDVQKFVLLFFQSAIENFFDP